MNRPPQKNDRLQMRRISPSITFKFQIHERTGPTNSSTFEFGIQVIIKTARRARASGMLSKQDLLCSEVKLGGMAELCAECYEGRTFGSHINMHELNCIGGKVHKLLLLHLPSPIFDLNLRLPEGAVLNVRWKIANALLPPFPLPSLFGKSSKS